MTKDKTVTMSRELLDRVIARLEDDGWYGLTDELRAALAQEAGKVEPVAWGANSDLEKIKDGARWSGTLWGVKNPPMLEDRTPLYTFPPAPVSVVPIVIQEVDEDFEKWWESDGQYCRSGGGSYEKTFAYRAYEAAIARANEHFACLDKVKELNQ